MGLFILRRLFYFIPMLFVFSVLAFAVMQLQPGDFLSKHALTMSADTLAQLRQRYGLDQAPWVQYWKWVSAILTRGDFGTSFETQQPVFAHLFVNGNRLGWTLLLTGISLGFSWALALPLGIYLATTTYAGRKSPFSSASSKASGSRLKYALHALGTGTRWATVRLINALSTASLALPNFLTALLILWLLVAVFQVGARYGLGISGLFDAKYVNAPWSLGRLLNFLWHLWPVVLVVSLSNMAQLIRYMRAHLLDVLGEPYVQTARAKGLEERAVVYKHAVRNALNPLVSLLGLWIPLLFEGMLVAAFVLQLPVVERAYWRALATEDQYVVLAGLLFFALVLLVGNLLSDVLLALVNPRIRYE